jgi:hypothetical protein
MSSLYKYQDEDSDISIEEEELDKISDTTEPMQEH